MKRKNVEKKYDVILADPPWQYRDGCSGERGVVYKYRILSQRDLLALPVSTVAADNCVLFLWATWPMIQEALSVIEGWGFKYKTIGFVWIKTTRRGRLHWGMGNWTRSNSEMCLIGIKGKPKRISASIHSVVIDPVGEHSTKPTEVHQRIEALTGGKRKLEMFARSDRKGWDVWGDEVKGVKLFKGWKPS